MPLNDRPVVTTTTTPGGSRRSLSLSLCAYGTLAGAVRFDVPRTDSYRGVLSMAWYQGASCYLLVGIGCVSVCFFFVYLFVGYLCVIECFLFCFVYCLFERGRFIGRLA